MLYLLLEFWPKGMRKDAKVEAHEVLDLLNSHGYAIFDTRTVQIGGDRREPQQLSRTFGRPMEFKSNVDWYHQVDSQYGSKMGYWTDMLAVATQPGDLGRF